MKLSISLLFFIYNFLALSQDCVTLYSDNERVKRYVWGNYRNCEYIDVDTIFDVMRYEGYDLDCYKLYHKTKNYLISEFWKNGDTTFLFIYHSNGKLKSKSIGTRSEWLHYSKYFNNGIQQKSVQRRDTLNKIQTFYPSGNLRAEWYEHFFCAYNQEKQYYENGNVAVIIEYSEFSDSLLGNKYIGIPKILSETYYDLNGQEIAENPLLTESFGFFYQSEHEVIIDSMVYETTCSYRLLDSDQLMHDYEMSGLAERITQLVDWNKLSCKKGIAWVSLVVNENSEIENPEVEFVDDETCQAIVKAIKKINKWEVKTINNAKVRVNVCIPIILNF